MTLCERITNPITKLVNENKDLDEIANDVCPTVKYGREKIIRIIKDFLGEEYLIQHAETLKYDIEKAQLAKKRIRSSILDKKTHQKIDATEHSDSAKSPQGKSTKHGNKGACSQQCGKQEPKQGDSESEIDHKNENEQIPQCAKSEKQHAEIQPTKLSFDDVVKRLIELIELSSLNTIKSAIEAIEHDEGLMASASIKPTEALVNKNS